MTTQQLLLTFIATATILATAAGIGTARRFRRYRPRPISWTCLECGHTENTRARTRSEAWSWIGGKLHAHALQHPDLMARDSFADTPQGMNFTHTVPPEWARRQE